MYFEVAENFNCPLITLLTAASMSFSVIDFRRERIANIPASVHTLRISAPVASGQSRASSSKRMFFSHERLLQWIRKICVRPSRSGGANSIFRSIRPGRVNAGSSVSGRFVAIIILMFPHESNPSIWFTSSSIVRWTSLSSASLPRAPPIASISSKKMMQAFLDLASWKISRMSRAPSPTYFCTSSLPITRMNVASVRFATALAKSVFPVPGVPYSSTPFGGSMPTRKNFSGSRSGSSTTSRICRI
mmetsp:Transcript_21302/g.33130  ORF Transcript_21302/g.33130 Transcript_21302/m.33130 type:complete len:246 (-) Transcript_21302:572-1309(-)